MQLRTFYFSQACAFVLFWTIIWKGSKQSAWDLLASGPIQTKPFWFPLELWKRTFLRLAQNGRKTVFISMILSYILGGICNGPGVVFSTIASNGGKTTILDKKKKILAFLSRLLIAISTSVYHLLETASTNRHGEYPVLFVTWVLALTPQLLPTFLRRALPDFPVQTQLTGADGIAMVDRSTAQAMELTQAIGEKTVNSLTHTLTHSFCQASVTHFVLLAGIAKVLIGGFKKWAVEADTLKTYLQIYAGDYISSCGQACGAGNTFSNTRAKGSGSTTATAIASGASTRARSGSSTPAPSVSGRNTGPSGPLSRKLYDFVIQRDFLLRAAAFGTILLECGLIPTVMILKTLTNIAMTSAGNTVDEGHLQLRQNVSERMNLIAFLGMVGMHIGIALVQSKTVGLAFLTVIPTYALAFLARKLDVIGGSGSSNLTAGSNFQITTIPTTSTPSFSLVSLPNLLHIISCASALGPTLLVFLNIRKSKFPLPENWPFSPISLFMWNSDQTKELAENAMLLDTRVVILPENLSSVTPEELKGVEVRYHGGLQAGSSKSDGHINESSTRTNTSVSNFAYDAVLRLFGFTILQGEDELLKYMPGMGEGENSIVKDKSASESSVMNASKWNVAEYCDAATRFLTKNKGRFLTLTGELLTKVAFVKTENNFIKEVLHVGKTD